MTDSPILRSRAPALLALCALFWTAGAPALAHEMTSRHAAASAGRKMFTKASWYGDRFKNHLTASGIPFDPSKLTGAHRTLPLGSHVRVTDLRGGRSIVVKIVDRGPYVAGRGIDLSYAAAKRLGMVRRGVVRVSLEVVPDPNRPPVRVAQSVLRGGQFPGAIVR